MAREPYYSRQGGDLYRLHRKAGVGLVAEEWVECAWRGVSDLDYVVYRTTPISAGAAANLIETRCGPEFRPSEAPGSPRSIGEPAPRRGGLRPPALQRPHS
jgi:hypothetical protein